MAWIKVANTGQLQNGDVIGVHAGQAHIALYRDADDYFATDNVCTHQYALLSDGYMEDGCIECPLHQATFDIRTGKAQCAPATKDLVTYPVKVEGDDVLVDA
jgi:3-phenylpropionate/trans-cinnamate dioxygenase ferredoxin subunit